MVVDVAIMPLVAVVVGPSLIAVVVGILLIAVVVGILLIAVVKGPLLIAVVVVAIGAIVVVVDGKNVVVVGGKEAFICDAFVFLDGDGEMLTSSHTLSAVAEPALLSSSVVILQTVQLTQTI